jgi:FkbM family methyltransferase
MKSIPKNLGSNEERTSEYINTWNTEKLIKNLINKSDPCIFDVGSNNGSSIYDFKNWWPESTIHCFEPQEECVESLKETASKFDKGEIHINICAAGNISSENETFYTHNINSGVSGFNKINTKSSDSIKLDILKQQSEEDINNYINSINQNREVQVIRLDEYIDSLKPDLHIDFLKIDTQGHEVEVLEGIGKKLENVDLVLTELMFFDFYEKCLSFSDIEKYLHKYNFRIYDISHISKNPMNGRTDWVDVIYINDRIVKK